MSDSALLPVDSRFVVFSAHNKFAEYYNQLAGQAIERAGR